MRDDEIIGIILKLKHGLLCGRENRCAASPISFNYARIRAESARLFADEFDKRARKKVREEFSFGKEIGEDTQPHMWSSKKWPSRNCFLEWSKDKARNPMTSMYMSHRFRYGNFSIFLIFWRTSFILYLCKPMHNQFLCDGDWDRHLQFCQEFKRSSMWVHLFSDECVFSSFGTLITFISGMPESHFRIGNQDKTQKLYSMSVNLLQWTPPIRQKR